MEDSNEFKWAVKVVIKRQMRDLLEQLRDSGEEVAVISVNMKDDSCSFFGSPSGEWFISEQNNLAKNFLNFCKNKTKKLKKPSGPQHLNVVSGATKSPSKVSSSGSTPALLKIKLPKQLSEGISKQELAGLVGNLVANKMKADAKSAPIVQQKIGEKRACSQTVATALASKRARQAAAVAEETPRSTRSGRPLSARYMETMKSLVKKSPKKVAEEKEQDADEDVAESFGGDDTFPEPDDEAIGDTDGLTDVVVGKDNVKVRVSVEDEEDSDVPSEPAYTPMSDDSEGGDVSVDTGVCKIEEENNIDGDDPDYTPPRKTTVLRSVNPRKAGPSVSVTNQMDIKARLLKKKKKKKSRNQTRPIQCEHCGDTIIGMSNLKCHISRVHLKEKTHICDICNKGFWGNSSLEAHKLAVHTRQCDTCKEYVVESVPWDEGVNLQTRRDVMCTCGAVVSIFTTVGRRRQYARTDDDENDDGRPPSHKSDPATKYACGTCGKLFLKKANCERHARTHSEVKNIVCDICGNKYMFEGSLRKHLFQEHNIVKNICEICGKNYSNARSLKLHITKVHQLSSFKDEAVFDKEMDELAEEEENVEERKEADKSIKKIILDARGSTSVADQFVAQTTTGQVVYTTIDRATMALSADTGSLSLAQDGSAMATTILVATGKQDNGDEISGF